MSVTTKLLSTHHCIPMTPTSQDSEGRQIQLWRHPKHGPFGTVTDLTGKVNYIATCNITNPCDSSLENFSLQTHLTTNWDLVYQKHTGKITIWPLLEAAGKTSVKPTHVKKALPLNLWQKSTSEKKDKLDHMFQKERDNLIDRMFQKEMGHLAKNALEHLRIVLEALERLP